MKKKMGFSHLTFQLYSFVLTLRSCARVDMKIRSRYSLCTPLWSKFWILEWFVAKVIFNVSVSKARSSEVSFPKQDLLSHGRKYIFSVCYFAKSAQSLKKDDLLPFNDRTEFVPRFIFNPIQTFCCSLFPSSPHVDSSMMRYWLLKWLVREAWINHQQRN